MNRQAIFFASSAAAIGTGLFFIANRAQLGSFARNLKQQSSPESWRKDFEKQIAETAKRIGDTRELIEEAGKRRIAQAPSQAESVRDAVIKAVTSTALSTLWVGALGSLLIFVYAPEHSQQEKLWQTTRSITDPIWNSLTAVWQFGAEQVKARQRPENAPGPM